MEKKNFDFENNKQTIKAQQRTYVNSQLFNNLVELINPNKKIKTLLGLNAKNYFDYKKRVKKLARKMAIYWWISYEDIIKIDWEMENEARKNWMSKEDIDKIVNSDLTRKKNNIFLNFFEFIITGDLRIYGQKEILKWCINGQNVNIISYSPGDIMLKKFPEKYGRSFYKWKVNGVEIDEHDAWKIYIDYVSISIERMCRIENRIETIKDFKKKKKWSKNKEQRDKMMSLFKKKNNLL